MPTTNTFVVQNIVSQGNQITVYGTVNGVAVAAGISTALWPPLNVLGFESLVASALLAAVVPVSTTVAISVVSWTSTS